MESKGMELYVYSLFLTLGILASSRSVLSPTPLLVSSSETECLRLTTSIVILDRSRDCFLKEDRLDEGS